MNTFSPLIALFLLLTSIVAKLEPKGIQDLKTAPLVVFAHDFPKHPSNTFKIDQEVMIRINITNASPLTKTVYGIEGAFTDPSDASKTLHKISKERVQVVVKPGKTAHLKYKFTPRMEPADVGLLVTVDYYDSEEPSYKSVGALEKITVVYGDSPYDLQSISIYVLFAGVFAAIVSSFFGSSGATTAKPTKVKKEKYVKPTAAGPKSTEPDMDWIPDHVKKVAETSTKKRK